MHAIRQYEFGGPEQLRYEEVPDLRPGEGQVRIAVEAAGVHLVDTTIRQGLAGGAFATAQLPMTPGREVAGIVDHVGPDVDEAWLGRRVVAHLGMASGGYAEQAIASAGSLHVIPDGLTPEGAVAMIGTGRTAVAVLEVAALTPEDVVVVTSAAGGLGSLLVQAARHIGAFTAGLAGGASKVEQVRRLGADVAVDYSADGWPDRLRDQLADRAPTVALDGVGGKAGSVAFELLAPRGRTVLFGYSSGEPTVFSSTDIIGRSLTVTAAIGPRLINRPGGLRPLETEALARAASGELVPLVESRFRLADAATAHAALESRATTGKVVLTPSGF
jgi:NADPH2:quinone reductase